MSLGEVTQISEGIYAYLQPDGSWHLNNTAFLDGSWETFTAPTGNWMAVLPVCPWTWARPSPT